MEVPFKTVNPSQFKLRLAWGLETGHKLVAEFADCSWLPCKGDIMILPVDENLRRKTWNQYKVANVIYDFEHQITRVVCAALTPSKTETHSHKPLTTTQRLQSIEKWGEAIAANSPKLSFETSFNESELLKDVDEELQRLKSQLTGKPKEDAESNQYVDTDLESLRKNLQDM